MNFFYVFEKLKHKGEVRHLGELSKKFIYIGSDTINTDKSIHDYIKSKDYTNKSSDMVIHKINSYKYKYGIVELKDNYSCEEISDILNDFEQNEIVNFAHYTFQAENCIIGNGDILGSYCVESYSSEFMVYLKSTSDESDLNDLLIETNTSIDEQIETGEDIYIILIDKNSLGDALEMNNYFYESGLFEYIGLDIIKFAIE